MGVKLTDLAVKKPISLDDLSGKVVAIDTFNVLYQFLTSIRMRDGTPLQDSKGHVVSHLHGLFSRTSLFLQKGIKPIFIFDGKPPELKKAERDARRSVKEIAQKKYDEAALRGDEERMRTYASMTVRLTPDILSSAKELIRALGCPVLEAPSEGEAQAAHLVAQGDAYASVSQDFDSLLFGTPLLVRNLTQSKRRKKGFGSTAVAPELISLSETLQSLGIDREGLIVVGMLAGTDFNRGGIKGLGPKKALKLVQGCDGGWDDLFSRVKWSETFSVEWKEVFNLFLMMPVSDQYDIQFKKPNPKKILELLCTKHGFDSQRVKSTLKKITKKDLNQKGLGDFF